MYTYIYIYIYINQQTNHLATLNHPPTPTQSDDLPHTHTVHTAHIGRQTSRQAGTSARTHARTHTHTHARTQNTLSGGLPGAGY